MAYEFKVGADGTLRYIHSDEAARIAAAVGKPIAKRASHVEPDPETGWWVVDLSPVGGPSELGRWPADQRDAALAAEVAWLREHRLGIVDENDRERG